MAFNENLVVLIGHVGKDAETKTFSNGSSIVNFSLATSDNYKNKEGEWINNTDWHNIVVQGRSAERASSIQKGDNVKLTGKIKYRTWQDKEGNTKYTTEIVCNTIQVDKKQPVEQANVIPPHSEDDIAF